MTVEEKLDELDPNIMGIDWEKKIEEPMRRECLEKLENGGQMQEFIMHCRNMQKNKHVWEFRFCSMRRPWHGLHRRDATIFPQQLTLAGAF